jgi:hypothetical protein
MVPIAEEAPLMTARTIERVLNRWVLVRWRTDLSHTGLSDYLGMRRAFLAPPEASTLFLARSRRVYETQLVAP